MQLTPPGSACSIARGRDRPDTPLGPGLHLVVPDIRATWPSCSTGVEISEVQDMSAPDKPSVSAYFKDPDGNGWACNSSPTETAPFLSRTAVVAVPDQHASDAATRAVTWTSPATTPRRSDQA